MSHFHFSVQIILKHEGGFVDNPSDPGGATNHGISQRAYPNLDIKNLTARDAANIYRRDYWDVCQCEELPWPISLYVFDAGVNQGTGKAIRMLQSVLGVKQDGVLGPVTLAAIENYPGVLGADYLAERAVNYGQLAAFSIFGKGWMRRLFNTMDAGT